ncbi:MULTISPECIES: 2-oxo acid dehydrogenase subunit E2 [Sulfurimonas]|uniref:2-oxo acid dehydrogenase subunit E2 n=1 Tax=Sulfurimonas TaxID=202746 RepID=UPI001265838B|nr:2-oxo acid dehydrogenase subunit E2 [Sulfurimonas indica]
MYDIVMPQLSDSMDDGKLIAWKVDVGQTVKSGDIIAEIESDKAIMELQSFQDGIVEALLVDEGAEVPVGTVIAKIATDEKVEQAVKKKIEKKEIKQSKPKELKEQKKKEAKRDEKEKIEILKIESADGVSPKARAKAAQYGITLQNLMQHTQKVQLHADDVERYINEHYFTPKAQKLLLKYKLEASLFALNHKIDEVELQEYIDEHEIPLPCAISSMQKAIISNVTSSAKKPVFHIYEYVDATLLQQNVQYSITAWFIKIFADIMMRHDTFRSRLQKESLSVYPNASISLAVADTKELYMPVIKDANKLTITEIDTMLKSFKSKLQNKSFTQEDMHGSTFGISNLGMLGIKQFDAMIKKKILQ